eukprot:scaffold61127_cov41-Phaeocystis_antarctica.AAC.1
MLTDERRSARHPGAASMQLQPRCMWTRRHHHSGADIRLQTGRTALPCPRETCRWWGHPTGRTAAMRRTVTRKSQSIHHPRSATLRLATTVAVSR